MATRNWPHPVLDTQSGDYPNCAFQTRLEIRQTKLDYKVHVDFDLGCESLEQSIAAGNAQYLVQVTCARTAYRQVFPTTQPALELSIPEHELRDTFVVSPFIVSTETIQLRSDEISPTFDGMTFTVRPGAVLAVSPPTDYVAEKVFDELKNISSIFEVIRQYDPKNEAIEYDLTGNKIAIALPHKVHAEYQIFRSRPPYREMFVCSLVLPGLTTAIEILATGEPETSESLRWRRVIRRRLKETGRAQFNADESFRIAQELLEFPFTRTFQAIRAAESAES